MKVVSFSLYGDKNCYCVGAVKNAVAIPIVYPGWRMFVYHDNTVPEPYLETLAAFDVTLVNVAARGIHDGLFWRFLASDEPGVTRFIVRDADSRVSPREAQAVNDWESSGLPFHSMRDHPAHNHPLCGGMWGGIAGVVNMADAIRQWMPNHGKSGRHDPDQEFLTHAIWPHIASRCLQHDSFYRRDFPGSIPFPSKRAGQRFVGEVMDARDVPRHGDYQQIPIDS